MKDIYLTGRLKEKYATDFNKNVLTNKVMPLGEGLDSILINVNENPNIQSLYSQKCNSFGDDESYFEFCYTKECELEILRKTIPELLSNFNLEDKSRLNYEFRYPAKNPNYHENQPKKGILCMDDKDYFYINHIKIRFFSFDNEIHEKFWKDIGKEFSKVGINQMK